MGNRPIDGYYTDYHTDYFSELKMLIDAQNKAREYSPSAYISPAENPGKNIFLRLKKHLMQILINNGWRES